MKNEALGYEWQDVRKKLFTAEEIAASDLRVALIRESSDAHQKGTDFTKAVYLERI